MGVRRNFAALRVASAMQQEGWMKRVSLVAAVIVLASYGLARAEGDEDKPAAVPIQAVQKQMVAGEREIHLPTDVLKDMAHQGISRAIIMVKLCLSAEGTPTVVEIVKGSGYQAADDKVVAKIRDWRFKPYMIDGKPVGVCTAVMFNYNIDSGMGPDALEVFKPFQGTWRCTGPSVEATAQIARVGAFVVVAIDERRTSSNSTPRHAATTISYDARTKTYVSAGTDALGNAWTAQASAPGSSGTVSWLGPNLAETVTVKDGSLEIHGRFGNAEPKWDYSCKR
jgi:TonB family protein